MRKTPSAQLKAALRAKQLVRFSRRFEESPVRGYVMDIGPVFFMIAVVSDRLWFDGYECFRVKDVHGVKQDPYADFAESALKKRRERRPKKPDVNVNTIAELLETARKAFPLVTIHREGVDPSVCWIGRIVNVENSSVQMIEINPDATWDEEPTSYPLKEITRVNFGGDYENALHLVAGNPRRR